MFFKKKNSPERWNIFKVVKPETGVEVLMSTYERIWFGRIEMWKNNNPLVFRKNSEDRFEFSHFHAAPLFWMYIPRQPERLNPEAPLLGHCKCGRSVRFDSLSS